MEKGIYKTLRRYRKPRVILPSDLNILYKCAVEGLVKMRYVETFNVSVAGFTDYGYREFRMEELRRNPFKRLDQWLTDAEVRSSLNNY